MRRHALIPAENIRGALCIGDARFTAEKLSRIEVGQLLGFCHRCPVLTACIVDRERWRAANPEHWAKVTGVWGGQAWTRGAPYKGIGHRAAL